MGPEIHWNCPLCVNFNSAWLTPYLDPCTRFRRLCWRVPNLTLLELVRFLFTEVRFFLRSGFPMIYSMNYFISISPKGSALSFEGNPHNNGSLVFNRRTMAKITRVDIDVNRRSFRRIGCLDASVWHLSSIWSVHDLNCVMWKLRVNCNILTIIVGGIGYTSNIMTSTSEGWVQLARKDSLGFQWPGIKWRK